MAETLRKQATDWLFETAFPFWLENGMHKASGGFIEGTNLTGEVLELPRRSMVQGRHLYVLSVAHRLGFRQNQVAERIRVGADSLIRDFSLPSGAFFHAVDESGKPKVLVPDLYAQSFVLFGLACAYGVAREERWKSRAIELLQYLERDRRLADGGFSELALEGETVLFRSNPHMHLFEAALAWMAVDPDPRWKALADELYALAAERYIDRASGCLAEYFEEGWEPLREGGRFIAEPGHHYEWSWLMQVYGAHTGKDVPAARPLFETAEKFGLCRARGVVFDEIWSDGSPKKKTSRYWPQCERIKAAVRLGAGGAADQALASLLAFLDTPVAGLCFDHMLDDGSFVQQPPRSSFLYHVVNGMDEYLEWR